MGLVSVRPPRPPRMAWACSNYSLPVISGWAICSENSHLSAGLPAHAGGVAECDVVDVEEHPAA